jgi:hypothetical protein
MSYFLKLIVDPSGPAFDLNVPVELIIGTIPLQSAVQQYQQTLSAAQPSAPPQVAMREFEESLYKTNINEIANP